MLTKILKYCKEEQIFVCLILNLSNWEQVIIGKILSFNSDNLIIDEINPYGDIVYRKREISINKIRLVQFNDIYGRDLKYLSEQQITKKVRARYFKATTNIKNLDKRLIEFQKSKEVTSVFLGNDYSIGVIKEFDDKYILLHNYAYIGLEDGFTLIEKYKVTKIRFKGPVEIKVATLKEFKNE